MEADRWIFENSANLKDLGLFLFGAVGAFFTYRAWRQKRDEIKEKYFERRYEIYSIVQSSVRECLLTTDKFEWWNPLINAKDRAEFLISVEAKNKIGQIHNLLTEYSNKVQYDDQDVRVSSKLERKMIESELRAFNSLMEPYLRVGK